MQFSSVARTIITLLALAMTSGVKAETSQVVYFHTDALGSPTTAFNANGDVCWRETYSPYGEKLENEDWVAQPTKGCGYLGSDRGHTGHVQDDGGLVYAQQRYYDPAIGRFMSTDPVSAMSQDPRFFGRYHYANNNPYRYTDPNGESPLDIGFFAYDTVALAVAVWTGVGVPSAAADFGLSAVGLFSPVPGTGVALKAARAADKAGDVVKVAGKGLNRPYIRKGVRETVESKAKKTSDGKFRDANTGRVIDGKYDLGHKRGNEFRTEKARAEAEGLSQKEFNNRMNDPNLYQIEHPSLNRSHRFEKR